MAGTIWLDLAPGVSIETNFDEALEGDHAWFVALYKNHVLGAKDAEAKAWAYRQIEERRCSGDGRMDVDREPLEPSVGAPAEEQPDARAERDPFDDSALERLARSNMDYYRTHGHYVPPLAQRLLDARAANAALTKELETSREQLDAARQALQKIEGMADEDDVFFAARAALGDVAAGEQTTDLGANSAKTAEVRGGDKEAL